MKDLPAIFARAMQDALNVLLYGRHGVGKTQMVCAEIRRQKLTFKYYSSATLDPWADLVGIPLPVDGADGEGKAHKQLQFIRPTDVEEAEVVFFDELNRSHPKVQNAVLEMVQFKSINGKPLPKLRMVWAAINPPNDIYEVSELDPALIDRFHMHVPVQAAPSVEYYRDQAGIPELIAKALVLWWHRDLSPQQQQEISPRRLEYLGQSVARGVELELVIPPAIRVPLQNLLHRIDGKSVLPFPINRETIVSHQERILSEMAEKPEVQMLVAEEMKASPNVLPRCVPLYLALKPELQAELITSSEVRSSLKNLALQASRNGNQDLRALHDRLRALGVFNGRP